MSRLHLVGLALLAASAPAFAQDSTAIAGGRCATPDSIAVRGNARVAEATIRSTVGIAPGRALAAAEVRRAIAAL